MLQSIYYMVTEHDGLTKQNILENKQLEHIAKNVNVNKIKEDQEYLFNLFVEVSCIGEEAGFITDFKYAVKLMADCFDEN